MYMGSWDSQAIADIHTYTWVGSRTCSTLRTHEISALVAIISYLASRPFHTAKHHQTKPSRYRIVSYSNVLKVFECRAYIGAA